MENSPQPPAKKQSKWSPEEDAKMIELRGDSMKWEDISKALPGRSPTSCRLHYQNYLERRSEWDEDRKNKLARLYERFKADMWLCIAEEMALPWRAVEAVHWQMGEQEMARRTGVTPFSLSHNSLNTAPQLPGQPPNVCHDTAGSRLCREALPNITRQQLPRFAELTAGLQAYASNPPAAYMYHQNAEGYLSPPPPPPPPSR